MSPVSCVREKRASERVLGLSDRFLREIVKIRNIFRRFNQVLPTKNTNQQPLSTHTHTDTDTQTHRHRHTDTQTHTQTQTHTHTPFIPHNAAPCHWCRANVVHWDVASRNVFLNSKLVCKLGNFGREKVCACVCVRERECVCVCVCESVAHSLTHTLSFLLCSFLLPANDGSRLKWLLHVAQRQSASQVWLGCTCICFVVCVCAL